MGNPIKWLTSVFEDTTVKPIDSPMYGHESSMRKFHTLEEIKEIYKVSQPSRSEALNVLGITEFELLEFKRYKNSTPLHRFITTTKEKGAALAATPCFKNIAK